MSPRAELKTARLTLRPVDPKDEGPVVACLNDIAVSGWLAVVPYPYSANSFQHFRSEYAIPGYTYAVDDGQGFAGIIGVEKRTLGYWFAPNRHGRGYATEAARAAVSEHFADISSDIASGYFEGNARSSSVLRKLGFVETGRGQKHCRALQINRPHVEMALTRDAFIAALPIEAQSARLAFRSLQAANLDAVQAIVSHFDVVRQLASFPWPPERDFTRSRAQPYLGDGFVWGAFLGPTLIGTVAVKGDELGYMFTPDQWRQGLATEACRTAITHAFSGGRDHLIAGVWADNTASLGLLGKLGFRVTGQDISLNRARGVDLPGYWMRLDRRDWPTA